MKHTYSIVAIVVLLTCCSVKNTDIEEGTTSKSGGINEYYESSIEIYEKTGIILVYGESFHVNDKGDTIYSHLIKKHNDDYTLALWYWEDSDGRTHDTMYWIVDSVSHIYELDEAALDTIHKVIFR